MIREKEGIKSSMGIIKNSLIQSHNIIENLLQKGDVVIDATCGNGNDTCILAEIVGEEGKVYSFDIQEIAIKIAQKRIKEKGFDDRVVFILDGHENMNCYINCGVKAVMFNLGYLPKGDHNIATKGETTIKALEKAMRILQINGIITVVVYYGGDSGFDEKIEVLEFISTIDPKKFNVMVTQFPNQINCPPILICIENLS